ncbi:MAG: hypothetical protein PHT16_00215 [Candidatus Pacebacteria bacterium]|nr:hypothetical protein [Candidatus Paceibacterota bacterium]
MKNFGQNIESSGHIGKSKNPEFNLGGQRNLDRSPEKSLHKEMLENSTEKSKMMGFLDEMVGKLSLPENYKIIDEAVGEDGASVSLANKIWAYTEKLGSKKIIPNSSVKDILFSQDVTILGRVERVKRRKELTDSDKEIIKTEFNFLCRYIDLLSKNITFETEELSHKLGFLEGKINPERLELLRKKDKKEFLEINEELL